MTYSRVGGLLLCNTGGLLDDMIEWLSTEEWLPWVLQFGITDMLLTACNTAHIHTRIHSFNSYYPRNLNSVSCPSEIFLLCSFQTCACCLPSQQFSSSETHTLIPRLHSYCLLRYCRELYNRSLTPRLQSCMINQMIL